MPQKLAILKQVSVSFPHIARETSSVRLLSQIPHIKLATSHRRAGPDSENPFPLMSRAPVHRSPKSQLLLVQHAFAHPNFTTAYSFPSERCCVLEKGALATPQPDLIRFPITVEKIRTVAFDTSFFARQAAAATSAVKASRPLHRLAAHRSSSVSGSRLGVSASTKKTGLRIYQCAYSRVANPPSCDTRHNKIAS